MKRRKVNVIADGYSGNREYEGAVLELPATPYEIEDALQRAHVPEGGGYELEGIGEWPSFLWYAIWETGNPAGVNVLGEMNLLADIVGQMDELQLTVYEGAVQLLLEEKGGGSAKLKELINLACGLNDYAFYPGVVNDISLGHACIQGSLLEFLVNLPDNVASLLDPGKVGRMLRHSDHGVFTAHGYVYRNANTGRELYDGERLPACGESHSGLLSLWIEKADAPDRNSRVWLELPAGEETIQGALLSIGAESLAACRIVDVNSIIPAFRRRFGRKEDIRKLNMLAEYLKEIQQDPQSRLVLMKYKAALELEQYPELDRMLDIAVHLDRYNFNPDVVALDAYGESVLKSAGIDTQDPAFSHFNFKEYGKRQLFKAGYVYTPYGAISRSGQEIAQEYMGQGHRSAACGEGMAYGTL